MHAKNKNLQEEISCSSYAGPRVGSGLFAVAGEFSD